MYTKVETWSTRGYYLEDDNKKYVKSENVKAENASSVINPSNVESKVNEIKELIKSINEELKTKVTKCVDNAGSDTISVNGKNYQSTIESLYSKFNLNSFGSELDNCVSEAKKKFNELQKGYNNDAKNASIASCEAKGGIYGKSSHLESSADAF